MPQPYGRSHIELALALYVALLPSLAAEQIELERPDSAVYFHDLRLVSPACLSRRVILDGSDWARLSGRPEKTYRS